MSSFDQLNNIKNKMEMTSHSSAVYFPGKLSFPIPILRREKARCGRRAWRNWRIVRPKTRRVLPHNSEEMKTILQQALAPSASPRRVMKLRKSQVIVDIARLRCLLHFRVCSSCGDPGWRNTVGCMFYQCHATALTGAKYHIIAK